MYLASEGKKHLSALGGSRHRDDAIGASRCHDAYSRLYQEFIRIGSAFVGVHQYFTLTTQTQLLVSHFRPLLT